MKNYKLKKKKKKKKKNIEDGSNGWETLRIIITGYLLFSAGVFIIIIIISNIFSRKLDKLMPMINSYTGMGINLSSDIFLLITISLVIYLSIDYLNNLKLKTFLILLCVNFISGIPRLILRSIKLN